MRKFFNKILSLILIFSVFISSFSLNIISVHADGEHKFLIKAYDWNAFDNDWEGSGTGDELINNADVEPGKVIQLSIYYIPGTDPDMMMQMAIKYDSTLVEPMYDEGSLYLETDMSTTYQGGIWPAVGKSPDNKKKTNWTVSANDAPSYSMISVLAEDQAKTKALTTEGVIASVYFKIKDTAKAGSVITFEYDNSHTKLTKYDNGTERPVITEGINLNVFGKMSANTLLKSLSVKNGTQEYPLNPTFVPDSETVRDYQTTVPNNITSVDISATASDTSGKVLPGGLGTKNLNVGENNFNLVVQSQDGTQEIYRLTVYRLNNDATLKSLTLTNGVNIGTFSGGTTSYTATVPYKTKSSEVTALTNDSNAVITSGTGSFDFTNYGTTTNTHNIVVNAENCDSKYASVPGNTCTSKTYTITVTRIAPSSNNNLSNLTVNNKTVTNFNKNTLEYTLPNVSNETTSLLVGAVVEDTDKAKIKSGTGTVNLNIGDNTLNIVVQAENGDEKTYKLHVRRLSNDNKLKSLEVKSTPSASLSPAFTSTFFGDYNYNYTEDVSSIDVKAIVNDTDKAMVGIVDANGSETLNSTLNTASKTFTTNTSNVTIVVTAEDGSIQNYTLNLVRAKSTDANLSSLIVNPGELVPVFSKETRNYNVTVDGSVTSINVNATPLSKYAKVESITGNTNLNFGNNQVEVVVKAESGNTVTYTINVERKKYDIALLDDIKVDGVSIDNFNKNTFEYTLAKVPFSKNKINVDATKTNELSTVKGLENIELKTGDNQIVIEVTAHNGITKNTYKLNIEREKNSDNKVKSIKVSGVTPILNDDGTYSVTLPNNKTTLTPNDVDVTISDDASIEKSPAISLSTKNDNIYTFKVTAENGDEKTYTIKVTRTKSNDTTLSKVTLTIGSDSSRYCLMENDKCKINVPSDTTKFSLTSEINSESTVSPVNGTEFTMTPTERIKDITLTVTAEDGTKKEYTVTVERQKSSNNNLSDIKVDNVSLSDFNKNKLTYNITVPGTTSSVLVSATVEDTGKAVITTDLSNKFSLDFGSNKIEIVVKAENDELKTYTLYIEKSKRINANLKDLKADNETITDFNKDKTEYTLDDVPFNKTELNISAIAEDTLAKVSGTGNIKLKTGDNKIIITVTAHDTSVVKNYIINVRREKNSDNKVKSINVSGVTPTLNDDGTYSVTLPNNKTTLTPNDVDVTISDDASIEKSPAISLSTKNDNIYTFKVTAENGDEKTYTIKVTRTKSNDTSINKVTLTIGTDSSRYCLLTDNKCKIGVPSDTTNFSLSSEINSESVITPANGTEFTMSSTERIKDITLTVTAEDGTQNEYTVTVEREKSSNNNLSDIKVDNVSVSGFNKDKLIYNLTVPGATDSVSVSAVVEDTGKATITTDLSNKFNLNFGSNQIDIIVTAENGDLKTYTLFIERSKRVNAYLKDLKINDKTITGFNKSKTIYDLGEVDYNTTALKVEGIAEDELATVLGNGLINLSTGSNTITLTVKAHDTSVSEIYKITVKRKLNDDTGIQGITLAGVPAVKDGLNYKVTVPNNVTKADKSNLIVTVNNPKVETDKKAEYIFNDTELLTTSDNEINILVTAEDGSVKAYTLIVTREKSDVALLSNLTVTNGSFLPSFSSNVFEYEVTVPVDVTEFNVTATKLEPNSKVTSGEGHYNISTSEKQIEVTVVSEDETKSNTYILNIKRTKSSINTLSDITVSEGTLTPEFNSNITSYTVNVDGNISSIDVSATLTDSRATIISGTGIHSLNVGDNNIVIRVESESGSILDYNINVIRAKKNINDLSMIKVDGKEIENFSSDTLEYDLGDVNYSKTKINVEAILKDADSSVKGDGEISLKTGDNEIVLTVTAQNGEEKTYKLHVNRIKNDNANLSLLSVMGYTLTPDFDKDTLYYETTVEEEKSILTKEEVTAVAEDKNASISKQDNIELSTTVDNIYKVTVTAEDGKTIKIYTIKVNRPKSSDTTLSKVNLTNAVLSPSLSKDKREYTLTIPYGSTEFTIEGVPTVPTTTVTGNGTYSKDDKVVRLTTIAEDGSMDVYIFNVVKALSNDATLHDLSVSGYNLDKTFTSTTLDYSIGDIPYGTTKLKINATPTNSDSTIKYYVGTTSFDSNIVNIPTILGENVITVEVTAADGIGKKLYTITYNIVKSDNAYLSKLTPSLGKIDFNKTTFLYNINVENNIDKISFDIETEDKNASIKVLSENFFTPKTITVDNLKEGDTTLEIIVVAQNGNTKTYSVIIHRLGKELSSDANLSSLSVNGQTLDKEFNMNETEYSIGEIPYSLEKLTINATPNIDTSTLTYLVNGNKQSSNVVDIPKNNGNGAITVQVTAEDGKTVKNYKITYSKQASSNAYLSDLRVSSGELSFNKTKYSYIVNIDSDVNKVDLTSVLEDNKSNMKINGTTYTSPHTYTISPLEVGNTEVVILVTAEDGTFLTYKVTFVKKANISEVITSVKYGHTIANGYIKTVKVNTTALELKDQLDNPNEYLEIVNSDETSVISDSDIVATGYIVKLMINGEEKDRKTIVIKGDVNGDGVIDISDSIGILGHYLNGENSSKALTGAYFVAGDMVEDSEIDISDAISALQYYLKN